jgi:hypothetical protein
MAGLYCPLSTKRKPEYRIRRVIEKSGHRLDASSLIVCAGRHGRHVVTCAHNAEAALGLRPEIGTKCSSTRKVKSDDQGGAKIKVVTSSPPQPSTPETVVQHASSLFQGRTLTSQTPHRNRLLARFRSEDASSIILPAL